MCSDFPQPGTKIAEAHEATAQYFTCAYEGAMSHIMESDSPMSVKETDEQTTFRADVASSLRKFLAIDLFEANWINMGDGYTENVDALRHFINSIDIFKTMNQIDSDDLSKNMTTHAAKAVLVFFEWKDFSGLQGLCTDEFISQFIAFRDSLASPSRKERMRSVWLGDLDKELQDVRAILAKLVSPDSRHVFDEVGVTPDQVTTFIQLDAKMRKFDMAAVGRIGDNQLYAQLQVIRCMGCVLKAAADVNTHLIPHIATPIEFTKPDSMYVDLMRNLNSELTKLSVMMSAKCSTSESWDTCFVPRSTSTHINMLDGLIQSQHLLIDIRGVVWGVLETLLASPLAAAVEIKDTLFEICPPWQVHSTSLFEKFDILKALINNPSYGHIGPKTETLKQFLVLFHRLKKKGQLPMRLETVKELKVSPHHGTVGP